MAISTVFELVWVVRDAADVYTQREVLDTEVLALVHRVNRPCRRVEMGNYTARPDLGYQSEN
jgi:hypothetical protein